ncbi:MAG: carbamoyltransferase HypF [Candidatus Korarchaeum sp.]|nr:carbamoyltransferase HypF [Candidatus Korarchaeum sp.]
MLSRGNTALNIRVSGIVQGVGFRPFIHRIATRYNLSGYVRNLGGSEVEIRIEGNYGAISSFIKSLLDEKPPPAKIEELLILSDQPNGISGFSILSSDKRAELRSMIPPDFSICEHCLKEVYDSSDRHYRYAFNSCAWCGPRFSMMRGAPYDRENTSMFEFPLCRKCELEYGNPDDERRFHAQGISCPDCGPSIWLEDNEGNRMSTEDPIEEAVNLIEDGKIVAVKGVGGYHITCLATDDRVVRKLRERKKRPSKPFALMALDLDTIERYAILDNSSRDLLMSPERPIVLLPKKEGAELSDLMAPGLHLIGFMLPYTALHHMLLNETEEKVLIMTSGNEHNKPMCTDPEDARRDLSGIVDYFLHHNRKIVNRVDDSVVRFTGRRTTLIRRSRGYAPMWVRLPTRLERPVIAFGAELQNVGAVAFDDRVVLTQFIGDTDELENLEFLDRMLKFFANAYGIDPSKAVLVADKHEAYSSRRLAELWASSYGSIMVTVQHHHAHLLSVMAEGRLSVGSRAVGIAVDGLGYGDDGTFWGGEVLLSSFSNFERVGHLRPQPMPGGDRASRYPVRMLIGILSTFMDDEGVLEVLRERDLIKGLPRGEEEARVSLIQARGKSPLISSVGRVMDAISSLLGICFERTYEGEPAMKLEAVASKGRLIDLDPPKIVGSIIDTSEFIGRVLSLDSRREDIAFTSIYLIGYSLGKLASANLKRSDLNLILVSGGAAVNTILISGIEDALREEGAQIRLNSTVPPGDGGIALGQVATLLGRREDETLS